MAEEVELRQRLDETRLPSDLREQILKELPSPEAREKMYREFQEKGGLSFEELLDPLLPEG